MVRCLNGDEAVVLFAPGDEFTGVDADWLIAHLRLDPQASPVDVMEGSLLFYLDSEPIEDWADSSQIFGDPALDDSLASFGDGGIIGGSFDITGEWMHFWAPEIANQYTWVGPNPDPHALTKQALSTDARYWEPTLGQTYYVESQYLDKDDESDAEFVLYLGAGADAVVLNGTRLR